MKRVIQTLNLYTKNKQLTEGRQYIPLNQKLNEDYINKVLEQKSVSDNLIQYSLQQKNGYQQQLFRRIKMSNDKQFVKAETKKNPLGTTGNDKEPLKMISFKCEKCDHTQQNTFTKQAYEKGVVLIQCQKCGNNHLIADNLKWFDDKPINIEQIVAEKLKQVQEEQK